MFNWFKNSAPASAGGMTKMTHEFGSMLDSGRHCFDLAANALLGGTDVEVIREDLFSTDQRINLAEQQIRRELVVHISVHGAASVPACLVLMSVVKDAERIGDYAKNIFDIAGQAHLIRETKVHADLVNLKNRISNCLATTRRIFDSQEEDAARELVQELADLEDHCDAAVKELLSHQKDHNCPATLVLAYRYFKRVMSHAMNVTSTIFMPLDKIDYFDEKPRPDVPNPS